MSDKFMQKCKQIAALGLAGVMLLAAPMAGAGASGVRDRTYTYVGIWDDIPIPDAFQFRQSIYIAELVAEADRSITLGRPSNMFITPTGNEARPQYRASHMFITFESVENNGIVVLDDNLQIVRSPRTGSVVWNEFSMPQEVFYATFAHMYPDNLRTEADIAARRDRFTQVNTCYDRAFTGPGADRIAEHEMCENCRLRVQFDLLEWVVEPDEPEPEPYEGINGEEAENGYDEYYGEYYDEEYEEITEVVEDDVMIAQINAIVRARGFSDRYEWREHAVAEDLRCMGDYYFVTSLFRPMGVFVCRAGKLYIADTQNNRVLVTTSELEITLVIYMPSARELGGERLAGFLPDAVVADTAGRISVVARNINNGILQFSRTGEFNRFIGAPSVQMDAWERLMRSLPWMRGTTGGTAFVPTEYNNIRIDEHNFIWGTISALNPDYIRTAVSDPTHDVKGIKRLNPLGQDILMRKGERGVWGDVPPPWRAGEISMITDVAIGPAGIYTMLDGRNGRMFTFNSEGIMLFAFGNIGTRKGNFHGRNSAVSIGYLGDNIAVLDATLVEVILFEPTFYGHLIFEAERHFVAGDYELAYMAWAMAAEQNANFSHAFFGLGTARFNDREFAQALHYFRHAGGDTGVEGYSRSRDMMRREQMETLFPIMSMVAVFGALALVGFLIYKGLRNYALSDDIIGYDREKSDD